MTPPPCCRAAAALRGPDVDPVQAAFTHTRGSVRASLLPGRLPYTPCRFDCPASLAGAGRLPSLRSGTGCLRGRAVALRPLRGPPLRGALRPPGAVVLPAVAAPDAGAVAGQPPRPAARVSPAGVVYLRPEAWVEVGRGGRVRRVHLAPGWAERLPGLAEARGVRLRGLVLEVDGHPLPLRRLCLRPLFLHQGARGGGGPRAVVAVDVQRWEVDFSGGLELQFAVGDAVRLGHHATLVRAVIGLGGEEARGALAGALARLCAPADLVAVRLHVDGPLREALGPRAVFRTSTLYDRAPPAGAYAAVVPGGDRHQWVRLLGRARGRRGPAGGPSAARTAPPQHPVPSPGEGRRPERAPRLGTPAFADPDLFWPATHAVDALSATIQPLPRHLLVTRPGCAYRADVRENPRFLGVDLGATKTAGCVYCPLGADYGSLPVPDYLGFLAAQIGWIAARSPEAELLVADEQGWDLLGRLLERLRDGGVRPGPLLIKARLNGLIPRLEPFERALRLAAELGVEVACYLVGVENFSDAELARYNKGITADALVAGLRTLLALEADPALSFRFTRHNSHGFILFNPWTTLDDLELNDRAFQALDFRRISGKAAWSRLRLHRWQPLYPLALRDGLVDEGGERFHAVVRRQLGYHPEEVPWRFASPATERVYVLVTRGIEAHPRGQEASLELFHEALAHVRASPPTTFEPIEALEAAFTGFREACPLSWQRPEPQRSAPPATPLEPLRAAFAHLERRASQLPWRLVHLVPDGPGARATLAHRSGEHLDVVLGPGPRGWTATPLGQPSRSAGVVCQAWTLALSRGG